MAGVITILSVSLESIDCKKVAIFSTYSSFTSVLSTSAKSCKNTLLFARSSAVATPKVILPTLNVTLSPSL